MCKSLIYTDICKNAKQSSSAFTFFDFGCIVVQAQSGSVPFDFLSASLVSQGKKGLTSEHLIGTLRVPAHSILEQGRRYIQTLYASAANTSLVLNI